MEKLKRLKGKDASVDSAIGVEVGLQALRITANRESARIDVFRNMICLVLLIIIFLLFLFPAGGEIIHPASIRQSVSFRTE
jgi:hypothetical protein